MYVWGGRKKTTTYWGIFMSISMETQYLAKKYLAFQWASAGFYEQDNGDLVC
jgi:hypothetical protein